GVGAAGAFEIDIVEQPQGPIMLFLTQAGNAFPVLIGLLEDANGDVEFSVETTVVALSLLNPNLFGTTIAEREAYIVALRANPDFQTVVDDLTADFVDLGVNALSIDENPAFYQALAGLMQSTMMSMGQAGPPEADELLPPPSLSGTGGVMQVMNPTFAYYGVGIYRDNVTWESTHTADRRNEQIETWGWPPTMMAGDGITDIPLADGDYLIHLNRGPDFSKMTDWDDPAGRATLLNSANIILSIMDLIVGQLPVYPADTDLDGYLTVNQSQLAAVALAVSQMDENATLLAYLGIVNANAGNVAGWLWQDAESVAAQIYLQAASSMMQDMVYVFQLLSYQDATGPFVYDLVNTVDQVNYYITVAGGEITEQITDEPPVAAFTVNPPAGIIETEFTFDASSTVDEIDPLEDLLFRWDFNGDGVFDTGWSSDPMATHTYTETGAWDVVMEAKDTSNLVGVAGGIVNVGGGAGTATHVKYFMDTLPWHRENNPNEALFVVLDLLGFTEGTGPNTYEVIPSTEMGTAVITPGEDLVIIANDQETSFYVNYAANMARFNNFVYMGGSMFWEACDGGWSSGSMAEAGVVLPGSVYPDYSLQNYNYVTNSLLPLVAGLPETLQHSYASHEAFINLPLGTTIYTTDARELSTLIEYSLGG
ncbi:MAG TPA: PKD domain-containing protein, partial [Bacteroidetes bacterium]|nr:PKD domain-containing protein [Bacteroidota bacterium]HEX05177.1 PKD domain-containing protein [Bacteroidota bacterium]